MELSNKNLDVPDELIEFIKTNSSFIIAGHKEPDGDCVGSQLALRSALIRLGKEAFVCSAGPFKRVELKNYNDQFVDIADIAARQHNNPAWKIKAIIVDCISIDRTGDIFDYLNQFSCAIIDHHASALFPPSTADAPVYSDPDSPSCTLLIYKLIIALGLELTKEEASLLLFGLCTDTGFFRHLTENNADAFEAAGKMISRGASPKNIFYAINGGKSLKSRVQIGNILGRTESHFNGRLLISCETHEEFTEFGLEGRDSDSLFLMLLSIENVEAVVIIRQESTDNCTVSLRSIDNINVAQIAAAFGGGGHKNASGLTMKGSLSNVKQNMLESFKKIYAD